MAKKLHPTSPYVIAFFLTIVIALVATAFFVKSYTYTKAPTSELPESHDPVPITSLGKVSPTDKFYCPILMYHHISDTMPAGPYVIRPDVFEEQMAWLKDNNYHVIKYEDFYNAVTTLTPLPEKPVVLTFDDNNKDQYYNALPVLKKYGYTGIFFIPTAYIDVRGGVMTTEMLKTLVKDGMEIGDHSNTHPDLRVIPREQLYNEELIGSKKILEKKLGISIKFFAYPGGEKSKSVVQAVEDTGYLSAVTTFYTPDHTYNENLYKVPRIYVDNNMKNFADFIVGKNLYKAH